MENNEYRNQPPSGAGRPPSRSESSAPGPRRPRPISRPDQDPRPQYAQGSSRRPQRPEPYQAGMDSRRDISSRSVAPRPAGSRSSSGDYNQASNSGNGKTTILLIVALVIALAALLTSIYGVLNTLKLKKHIKEIVNDINKKNSELSELSAKFQGNEESKDMLQGSVNSMMAQLEDLKKTISELNKKPEPQSQSGNSFDNLESYLQNLEINVTAEEADFANVLGATGGQKFTTPEGAKISIYTFDPASPAYNEAVQNGYVMVGGTENVPALFAQGKALIIDENFPQKDKISEDFKALQ